MSDYVALDFDANESDLQDAAVEQMQESWGPGWDPTDSDMEIILVETFSPLAVAAVREAAQMPPEALRTFGTKTLGIPYEQGNPASTIVTFEVQDNAGYTIPAGSQLSIDNFAFDLPNDLAVPNGSTTANATVYSAENTAAANNLSGASVVPISMPAFVVNMTVTTPTGDGADPETADEYVSRVSRNRRLHTTAIITTLDHELAALDNPNVGRFHAETTSGRNIQLTGIDPTGAVLSVATKDDLTTVFSDPENRLVNVTYTWVDPTFHAIAVAYEVEGAQGVDWGDLVNRINARLNQYLDPFGWGSPQNVELGNAAESTTWVNITTVYLNEIIAIIGSTLGVIRVVGTPTINGVAADYAMSGTEPLPTPGTMTGTVIA